MANATDHSRNNAGDAGLPMRLRPHKLRYRNAVSSRYRRDVIAPTASVKCNADMYYYYRVIDGLKVVWRWTSIGQNSTPDWWQDGRYRIISKSSGSWAVKLDDFAVERTGAGLEQSENEKLPPKKRKTNFVQHDEERSAPSPTTSTNSGEGSSHVRLNDKPMDLRVKQEPRTQPQCQQAYGEMETRRCNGETPDKIQSRCSE
ncbi:hypothetical protein Bbelb_111760 [Branchiostoma belcheri]|nr:hypothetical protein Bbelb_111760 [Branchiostoma belcheri]